MTKVKKSHMDDGTFHYIVRGIIRDGDHVLLVKQRGGNYTFLLGGHIDFGEPAEVALARELKEEIGIDATVQSFVGAIENGWGDECEISLVFDVDTPTLRSDQTPKPASPAEEHLEFLWVEVGELSNHNLLPTPLVEWLQEPDKAGWASTLAD
ncbi:MAG: NUDIX domain-containing protein [Phycisphaerales bacterium]|nr:NUDIX domain-containing protein [Phycisphaerales bacterium]